MAANSAVSLADLLLPVERMAEQVVLYVRHLAQHNAEAAELNHPDSAEIMARIAAILRSRTGHDFHGYKQNTFFRRVQRRMQVMRLDEIEGYIDLLRQDAAEAQNLFNDC